MTNLQKTLCLIKPFDEHDQIVDCIFKAGNKSNIQASAINSIAFKGPSQNVLESTIDTSDYLAFDVSGGDPTVMYCLGYARDKKKPMILIANRKNEIPRDLMGFRIHLYDLDDPSEFIYRLVKIFGEVREKPGAFTWSGNLEQSRKRDGVFISYCHKDNDYLERLLVHLKPLEKSGKLEIWSDKKIKVGEKWREEIEAAMNRATIAILLISADFLASAFIVDNELPPILKKAENEGVRIISVILKPCRFTRDSNLGQFQAINEPNRPIILLGEGDREKIFDQISEEVEKHIKD